MKTILKFKMKRNFGYLVVGIIFFFHVLTAQTQVTRVDHRNQITYKPLEHYWSDARTDNFTTATAQGKKAALLAKYRFVRKDGYVLSKPSNKEGQSVPIYLYYNAKRKDNFTTATPAGIKAAQGAGYKKIRIEGYILKTVNSKYKHLYKPLWLYYNDKRKDNFTVASRAGIKAAEKAEYKKVRIEGYVRINNSTNTGLPLYTSNDPFGRLKAAAKKTTTERSLMTPVKITVNNPNWKVVAKPKITFVPFKLEDKNGKAISPSKKVTLKNGEIITAQQFLNRANEVENKLNAQGYTLRNTRKQIVSKTITKKQYLDGREAITPKAISPLKKGNELKKFMSLQKRVKIVSFKNPFKKNVKFITLKPYSMYSGREKKEINKYVFSSSNGLVTAKKRTSPYKDFHLKPYGTLAKIHELNKTTKKSWNFGDPNTFQAGIEGSIRRYAKIYAFDSENSEKNKSEFKMSASGKVLGSLFGENMELLNASGEFYAPSDVNKKMIAKVQIKANGTTLYNINKEYLQSAQLSGIHGKSFDIAKSIEIPIASGIIFKGLIGIKGQAGFEYEGELDRTLAKVSARPVVNLEGYAEASLGTIGGFLKAGVEGKLTFIKGYLELQAQAVIYNYKSEQIILETKYYFGYNLEILSGSLSVYGEGCVVSSLCKRVEHELFKWGGYKDSGTIANGDVSIVLDNIAKYEVPVRYGR